MVDVLDVVVIVGFHVGDVVVNVYLDVVDVVVIVVFVVVVVIVVLMLLWLLIG